MASYEEFDRVQFPIIVDGQATAGTADEFIGAVAPVRGRVVLVEWVPKAAVTANATNYFDLRVRNRTTGAGATNIATRSYVATNSVAFTKETSGVTANFALNVTPANLIVAKGDTLTVEKVNTGTGLAMPAGVVTIYIAPN